jgi:hypothetical protein
MDAKITKKRVARMLSYDWLKIVGVGLALIIFWALIFTMTATRIRPSQQFTVFNHYKNIAFDNGFYNAYDSAFRNGTFSYEVIEHNYNDLAATPEYAHTLMEARFATDEGDVMLLPNISDPDSAKKNEETGETEYTRTYLSTLIGSYGRYVHDVDKYFANMEKYLNGFYTDWKDATTLNEKAVAKAFRARATANKDKRFRKEAEIQAGIKKDVKRIQKYRDALEKLYGYIEVGAVSLVKAGYESADGSWKIDEKTYGLDLCPDVATMGELKEQFAYYAKRDKVDENGEVIKNDKGEVVQESYVTAENMTLVFLNTPGTENGFQYEAVLYAVSLIEAYYTPVSE